MFVFVLIAGATLAGGGTVMLHRAYSDPGPLAADTSVVIPRGASGQAIASILVESGVAADTRLFAIAVRFLAPDRPLRAGEYSFSAGVSLRDAVAKLQAGDTVVRRLTVAEGLTTREILALVMAAEGLMGPTPEPFEIGEGAMLPETYHFSLGDTRAELVARMIAARDAALARLWQTRQPDLPLASPEAALILASIVERETAVPGERARVAGVFINRLRRGMRLQSDPTVAYGLFGENGALDRPLRRTDLGVDHPYNTYVHRGLPPGPIANPGLASIAAVLNPAATKDLYFVADGTGGHAFARTLAEHNRNVARWRRIQREQRAR
ncbi:MAG: endolytic transglycosylase MltG [Alphaproteobacteria bacterium]